MDLSALRNLAKTSRSRRALKQVYKAFLLGRLSLEQTRSLLASVIEPGKRRPPLVLLSSQTLDLDDVKIAREYLHGRRSFADARPVVEFQERFARWNGSKHAFAFTSGRAALSGCIEALGLRPGDEAVIPGYTCVVVPNAFDFAGVNLRFADIELDTFGLDVADVERKLTDRTKVLLIHHLFGLVCRDYDKLIALARSRGIAVIEDCAHSTGTRYRGVRVGNLGDVAFYSSEQSKIFNTTNGGVAVTNDPVLGERLKRLWEETAFPDEERQRDLLTTLVTNYYVHKSPHRSWMGDWVKVLNRDHMIVSTTKEEERGIKPAHYHRRMAPGSAAVGLNQLAKLDRLNAERRRAADYWRLHPALRAYQHPVVLPDSEPTYLRYPILGPPELKHTSDWSDALGVESGGWFASNIHPVPRTVPDCPNADLAVARCANLPTLLDLDRGPPGARG